MRRATFFRSLGIALIPTLSAVGAFAGWEDCDGWERDSGSKGRYCEMRELAFAPTGSLTVDADRNGGIGVKGSERNDVLVRARVHVWDRTEAEARSLAERIEIRAGDGRVWTEGPSNNNWSVSYEIEAPRRTDLDLQTRNGGLSVAGVTGTMRLEAHNGGLALDDIAGDVRARTTNGGLKVALTGHEWEGRGLDAETTNGGVKLSIPDDYSAQLETGTVNGRVNIDFPVTVQGSLHRNISTTLGSGGSPIRLRTTNGGVIVTRR
jgi:hypothetical protein